MPDLTPLDPASSSASRRDRDDDRLRDHAALDLDAAHAALDDEEKRALHDPERLRAAVLKRQALRRDEYVASNDPARPDNLDATAPDARKELDDHLRRAVTLAGGATLSASTPIGTPTLDLSTRVDTMSREQLATQIALTSAAQQSPFVLLDLRATAQMAFRLDALRQRQAELSPPMPAASRLPDAAALLRERDKQRAFLASADGQSAPQAERDARERYVATLGRELEARAEAWQASPAGQDAAKAKLYATLAAHGDTRGCAPGDTVDTLRARLGERLAKERAKSDLEDEQRIVMGAHGEQGTPDAVDRQEAALRLQDAAREIDAIQNGPLGAAASLLGRAFDLDDERRASLAEIGGAFDGIALSFGAQASESDRKVDELRGFESNLQLRRGAGLTHDQIQARAFDYQRAVASNKEWHWDTDIPDGRSINSVDRRAIRDYAYSADFVQRVPMKPATRFADFRSAGLVLQTEQLPRELWGKPEPAQLAWLDARIPGGRPAGTTWHHDNDAGEMQLVAFGLHYITSHNGGCSPGQWSEGTRKRK